MIRLKNAILADGSIRAIKLSSEVEKVYGTRDDTWIKVYMGEHTVYTILIVFINNGKLMLEYDNEEERAKDVAILEWVI